ncbi:ketol-acid reductoisomerase [Rhodothalassium salexigens]|uniref:ketol-acid reductoisomerase n=1 Tax=Rhodothalassium salexigens TaxID=1086 RepID=UPI00191491BF|nr:ketol-acid reductoisomerase [Rhodothalassium salexigens]MBK5921788.1 ketol-acid reductoisomerase [Rhodothalassium salexigens]
MKVYRDRDADPSVLQGRRLAVIGYGNQGHAHALNLRRSGYDVVVGARPGGAGAQAAAEAGFEVHSPGAAADGADLVMLTLPDEVIPQVYAEAVEPALRHGAALGLAHGLAIHFGHLVPRADLDVFLVGPKGAGRWLRAEYEAGRGLAAVVAVHQNPGGRAFDIALAYACGLGCGRTGILETTVEEEAVTDLFGEQAVLCGGLPDLLQAGYDTLVAAGYSPEMAYFECVHEAKLIVDLIAEGGFEHMRRAISTTAGYGGSVTGERVVTDATRAEMGRVLDDVQSGRFATRFLADAAAGAPDFKRRRAAAHDARLEAAGAAVRDLLKGAG